MTTETRTASILMSDVEWDAIRRGLSTIYRPIRIHWDNQFSKFLLEPEVDEDPYLQLSLFGEVLENPPDEFVDVVHLMRDTGQPVKDKETGRVLRNGGGSPKTYKRREQSRRIRTITNEAVFPEAYCVPYPDLVAGDPCWLVVLGEVVG